MENEQSQYRGSQARFTMMPKGYCSEQILCPNKQFIIFKYIWIIRDQKEHFMMKHQTSKNKLHSPIFYLKNESILELKTYENMWDIVAAENFLHPSLLFLEELAHDICHSWTQPLFQTNQATSICIWNTTKDVMCCVQNWEHVLRGWSIFPPGRKVEHI